MTLRKHQEYEYAMIVCTSPSTRALAGVRILEDKSIRYCFIFHSFQIIRYFGFSRYIIFTMYLYSTSNCVVKAMYLETQNVLYF